MTARASTRCSGREATRRRPRKRLKPSPRRRKPIDDRDRLPRGAPRDRARVRCRRRAAASGLRDRRAVLAVRAVLLRRDLHRGRARHPGPDRRLYVFRPAVLAVPRRGDLGTELELRVRRGAAVPPDGGDPAPRGVVGAAVPRAQRVARPPSRRAPPYPHQLPPRGFWRFPVWPPPPPPPRV